MVATAVGVVKVSVGHYLPLVKVNTVVIASAVGNSVASGVTFRLNATDLISVIRLTVALPVLTARVLISVVVAAFLVRC